MNDTTTEVSALQQARNLLKQGHMADAAVQAERTLEADPDNSEALYLLAVCHRYLKQGDAAQQALERLKVVRPGYGRAFQEQGHLCRDKNDSAAAIAAYEKAVACNPALPASWQALAALYQQRGDAAAAQRATAQHQRLAALPPELVSVASFRHEGKLYKAERLCRAFLQTHLHHPEAMRLLANIGSELHVLDDAEFLLESALEFDPDFLLARVDYVAVLQRRQKFDKALEQARKLRQSNPGNPALEALYADACMAAGDYNTALGTYGEVLRVSPDNPGLLLARGHALKTVGQHSEAVDSYRSAYRSRPDFGDAYWSLANLKTYRFEDQEIRSMRELEATPGIAPVDRYHLCFALGKALEDRREFDEGFSYYERGNALKREELGYRPERLEKEFAKQKALCSPELLAEKTGLGCPAADPIFIVGLPRSGSTLLEQVLASHSQVDGTFELPNILALVHRLRGRHASVSRYPDKLKELEAEQLTRLGQQYIDDTRMHRGSAPFFTDKMPNNFRHLGLIHMILPNARIIDARRNPMACCLSGFKQLFAEGQEFSYSQDDLGRYYRHYVELMDHWESALPPGRILRVRHEDMVADLEGQVQRMLNFLGLPFEPACLEFHKTERSVRTASSEQVRQPINNSGLEQWRNYEAWLEPLERALGQTMTDY